MYTFAHRAGAAALLGLLIIGACKREVPAAPPAQNDVAAATHAIPFARDEEATGLVEAGSEPASGFESAWEPKPLPTRSTHDLPLELAAFRAALCPYPRDLPPVGSVYGVVTQQRVRCLERTWHQQRERLADTPEGEAWWQLDDFFERWYGARCGVDEAVQWVEVETREWSDGTAAGDREKWCHQRMLEDRLFFHEARARDMQAFWQLVEGRQGAGRKIRVELDRVRKAAANEALPGEGLGGVYPDRWREFVHQLDVAADRPAILAQQHCEELGAGEDCRDRLTLYFHSIGADAAALDLWTLQ